MSRFEAVPQPRVGAVRNVAAPVRSATVFAAVFVGLFGLAEDLRAQGADAPEIESLEFSGNETFSDDELASAILLRETRCRTFFLQPFCWLDRDFAKDRSYLNDRFLRDDYVRLVLFYREHGFREAQIDTTVDRSNDGAVSIEFTIDENDPLVISSFDFLGIEEIGEPPVNRGLPIARGDRLDLPLLDVARDTLTRRLQNRGYPHAEVLRNIFVPTDSRQAEVEFDVFTGPLARFGPIDVVGNEEVSDRVILRMLPFGEGGLYRRDLLLDAQRNIYSLEIFLSAAIQQGLENEPDSIVPLQVQVNEGNPHRVRTGGGWNTEECLNFEAQWAHRNYFGGARQLVLRGRLSNVLARAFENSICSGLGSGVYTQLDWVVAADFSQPFIFSPRNSFAGSVYAERQSLRDVFVREAVGVNLALTRSVGRSTPLTLSYRPQLSRLDAAEVFFCSSVLVCDPVSIGVLQGSNTLSPVGLTLSRDRTNNPVSPTEGYRGLVDLESAGSWTGSDFEYDRAVAELAGFFEFGAGFVIAGRIRGGWLSPGPFRGLEALGKGTETRISHPEKRFYGGGSNSVRGFAQNQLGPQVTIVQDVADLLVPLGDATEPVCRPEEIVSLLCDPAELEDRFFSERPTGGDRLVEGSVELRMPFGESLFNGAIFMDFGRVWEGETDTSLESMAVTPGIGLRYETPIGPIRFDVAYRGDNARRLPVITSQVRPFEPGVDDERDRISKDLDWVESRDLAILEAPVSLGGRGTFIDRLQFHLSIGQAF